MAWFVFSSITYRIKQVLLFLFTAYYKMDGDQHDPVCWRWHLSRYVHVLSIMLYPEAFVWKHAQGNSLSAHTLWELIPQKHNLEIRVPGDNLCPALAGEYQH